VKATVPVHTPATQLPPAPHERPQSPQLVASVCVSTQLPPQWVIPPAQTGTHSPFTQASPEVQECPQPPQLVGSSWVLVQNGAPPSGAQSVSALPSALRHALLHRPSEHICAGPHPLPHDPQFAVSVWTLAQYAGPASGWQSICPSTQLEMHTPFEQTWPAPQAWKQEPQFSLS
jgi:hypothetical protein